MLTNKYWRSIAVLAFMNNSGMIFKVVKMSALEPKDIGI